MVLGPFAVVSGLSLVAVVKCFFCLGAWVLQQASTACKLSSCGTRAQLLPDIWDPSSPLTFTHWRRKWQPTPVFLPGESQGQGSLVGCRLWGRTESDTTEAT